MSGIYKKEFGDYQTPLDFCIKVCEYIKNSNYCIPKVAIDPTCGIGNFLYAVSKVFDIEDLYGVEINKLYAYQAKMMLSNAKIAINDIFDVNISALTDSDDVLIIGNPPWVTNSELQFNLPEKSNFKSLKGIDAITGMSNFDICEYIILQTISEYKSTNSIICMLCKTSVARNVLLEIYRNCISCKKIEILKFDSKKVFGVYASACVLIIEFSKSTKFVQNTYCTVKNFENLEIEDILTVEGGKIKTSKIYIDLEGKGQIDWRQGVKHDCVKVMELEVREGTFINKRNEFVNIENDLVFPLVKSSHFKVPVITEFKKFVIVTQNSPKEDTSYIKDKYPLTWKYLYAHIENFNSRKSIIYKKSALFSIFGIGKYSFAPYKVALSGFYKKPFFSLLYSSKPVMVDDTSYFLPFYDYDIAYNTMILLNSETVQNFIQSIAFLDSKRPYTIKLLSRIDFLKCVNSVSFEELKKTEEKLNLCSYITVQMYNNLKKYFMNTNKNI